MTPAVARVLAEATDLVGYGPYLDRVPGSRPGQKRHASDNRVELDRARHALALAAEGRRVAVVSGGDPGVFAMAAAVFEAIESGEPDWRALDVTVEPGVTAMLAAAAQAGAPLGADFCAISLSDNLKSWATIERRLACGGGRGFRHRALQPGVAGAAASARAGASISCKRAKGAETVVLLVRAAGTAEAQITAATLATRGRERGRHAHARHRRIEPDARDRARRSAAVGLHAARRARCVMSSVQSSRASRMQASTSARAWPCGLLGSRDHHDRQAEAARRLDLGVGRGAARVLGDEDVDALAREEPLFRVGIEGTALMEEADARRKRHVARRIDGAREIVVLGRGGEGRKLEASGGQEHAPRRVAEGGRRVLRPSRRRSSGRRARAPKRGRRSEPSGMPSSARRGDGVGRDVNRKRMCRVDYGLDLLLSEPGREAVRAAEAADPASGRVGQAARWCGRRAKGSARSGGRRRGGPQARVLRWCRLV